MTGGTGALGSAVVGNLLERGGHVHVPVFAEQELERFPHRDHPRVTTVAGVDLTDEASAESFYASRPPLWASLQIAGGFAMAPLEETSADDLRRMLERNLTTCFLACREAVRRIRAASHGGGRLVNVAAKPALVPTGGLAAYVASKAAVVGLTQTLSEELAPEGIWVNAVVPSVMDTPANRAGMPDADHDAWPAVADVAETLAFLASPSNRVTRGALVPVYGRS